MNQSQVNNKLPRVVISLKLHPSLDRILDLKDPLNEAVRSEISKGLKKILEILGIPGEPEVEIVALDDNTISTIRFLRVFLQGRIGRYSDELLQRVYSYVNGIPLGPGPKPDQILTWLKGLCHNQEEILNINHKNLVDFLSLTCLEIAKKQPDILLGSAQVLAYWDSLLDLADTSDLQPEKWLPDPNWLLPVLTRVLNLKISVANRRVVAKVLKEGLAKGRSPEDISEDLITALCADVVEIHLPQDYLKQITLADPGSGYDKFSLMRDGLFYELGLRYPKFQFVPVENLKPRSFTFKINHLVTLPWVGLPPNCCLVNDTPDTLKLFGIPGMAAVNPANTSGASLIDLNLQSFVESAGLTTWDQVGYLILCFSTELRENSRNLLHYRIVQSELDKLKQVFPALITGIHEKVSVEQITRVLRILLSEELSILNLPRIFQRLLDYDYIVIDSFKYIVLDDRLPISGPPDETRLNDPIHLASFVRSGMKRYISHKYTKGQNMLAVYLLDPEIEKILLGRSSLTEEKGKIDLDEDTCDKILEAVRVEIGRPRPYPSTSVPVILTTIDVRPHLRKVIALEFPRLSVLSYQELASDLNIQPIARISLY